MDAAVFAEVLSETRRFVRERVVPLEAEIDERDEIPPAIREQAKALGLYGFALPAQYGGIGLDMTSEVELVFELGWTAPAFRSLFGTNNGIAGHVLMLGGTEEPEGGLAPKLASGEVTAAFALTEPEAGSPRRPHPVARRDGEKWVIDGIKRYITNAPMADVFMAFARSDPAAKGASGISAFLVPADAAGLSVGPKDHKMGRRAH